jgi:hypothetical protein
MDQIVRFISRNTSMFAGIEAELNTTGKPHNWNKIGRLLFKMNEDAYHLRYPDVGRAAKGKRIEDLYEYRVQPEISDIQYYKTIQMFLYNCNESDELSMRTAYTDLRDLWNRLGRKIIESLPEYKAAKWG